MPGFMNPAAFGQNTMAAQMMLGKQRGKSTGSTKRRKRKSSASSAPRKRAAGGRKKKRAGARPARLVKGSAAAKRYMASIRKKRK